MLRLSLLASVGLLVGFAGGFVNFAIAVDSPPSLSERIANKAKVKGKFLLHQRTRTETSKGSGAWKEETQEVIWNASETAIIICDMWDDHYCKSAAERVADMAPRMNAVLTAARNHGATVIHAPSGVTY